MTASNSEPNAANAPRALDKQPAAAPLLSDRPPWLARRILRLRKRWYLWRQPERITLNGVTLRIERGFFSEKIIRRLYDGGYEAEECRALAQTLAPGDRLLELGAGIGYLASFAARRIGSDRVTTCEANPQLLPRIQRTFADNGVAPTLLAGVMTRGAAAGQMREFYVHERNFWSSSLTDLGEGFEAVRVPCLDWDTSLQSIRPNYLAMDIEGGEIDLLHDFDAPFVNKLMVEFHPRKSGQAAIDAVFEQLAAAGFRRTRVAAGAHIFYFER